MEEIANSAVPFDQLVQFLCDPRSYAESNPVECRETHISMVFLTSGSAYKLMKPVAYDFLDFRTREARYIDCWREVVLNRRFAGNVYRGVVPVTVDRGVLTLGGTGRCVDWLVHMRRLPDDATLQSRIERQTAGPHDLDGLLDVLCPFFHSALSDPGITPDAAVALLRRNVEENLAGLRTIAQTAGLPGLELARLESSQLQFLTRNDAMFRQRLREGWVRDGHGDLRAEHVYIGDPVVIVDCIEFNNRFRYVDSLDDVCFLASDLERLNRADLADYLLGAYRRRMIDAAPESLVSFYKSHRHTVRAKVAGLQAAQKTGAARQAACELASQNLKRAVRTLRTQHEPWLVILFGLSGTGKSTVAAELSCRIGARLIASDRVRKSLFGLGPLERSSDPKLYGSQANLKTYSAMREQAERLLSEKVSVVLDATFLRRHDREMVVNLAQRLPVRMLFAECRCPVDEARSRILRRQAAGTDASDAGLEVFESQLQRYEPPVELPEEWFFPVDTGRAPGEVVDQIVSRLSLV